MGDITSKVKVLTTPSGVIIESKDFGIYKQLQSRLEYLAGYSADYSDGSFKSGHASLSFDSMTDDQKECLRASNAAEFADFLRKRKEELTTLLEECSQSADRDAFHACLRKGIERK